MEYREPIDPNLPADNQHVDDDQTPDYPKEPESDDYDDEVEFEDAVNSNF